MRHAPRRRASRNVKYAESEESEEVRWRWGRVAASRRALTRFEQDFAASSRGSSGRKRGPARDEEEDDEEDAFEAQDAGRGSEGEGEMEEEDEDEESEAAAGVEEGSDAANGGEGSEEDGEPSTKRRRRASSRASKVRLALAGERRRPALTARPRVRGPQSSPKRAKKAPVKKEPKRRAAKPKRAAGVSGPAPTPRVTRLTWAAQGATDAANKKMKALSVQQQLDMVMRAYKWWEAEELPEGKRWRSLVHNGIMFPPSYERHNVKMLYDGKPVELTAKQEEVATFYAQIAPDGPQLGKPETAKTFNANFFKDFQVVLGKDHVIQDFDKCDFTPIRRHLEALRDAKKQMTKVRASCCRRPSGWSHRPPRPHRRRRRWRRRPGRSRRASTSTHSWTGTCRRCVAGSWRGGGGPACLRRRGEEGRPRGSRVVAQVGNVTVEPPGLFRGRGVHPKMGVIKERVMPGSISISISEDAVPPRCPVPGHAWKDVRWRRLRGIAHSPSVAH